MAANDDLVQAATEAARRYAANRRWTVSRIAVGATVHTAQGRAAWLRVTLTDGTEYDFKYITQDDGTGTLVPL